MNEKEFIKIVRKTCKDNNIAVVIKKKVKYADGTFVNGYFCDTDRVLAVSTYNDNWFPILVHEYGHLLQFLEDYKPFIQYNSVSGDFWCALEGKKVKKRAKDICQLVEFDCERRVLEMIKEYDLPIEPKHYAKRANAYVYFYEVVARTGNWYDMGNEPYNNKAILKRMPSKLDYEYKNVSEYILNLMEKNLFSDKLCSTKSRK